MFAAFRDLVLFLAFHLASFAVIAARAWVFGEALLRRGLPGRLRDRWAVAATLGWGLIAQSIFFLGLLRLLERPVVLGLLALGHLACLGTWRSFWSGRPRPSISWVAGGLVVLPLFTFAIYPPAGFDATV